jgi:hypothetical protein
VLCLTPYLLISYNVFISNILQHHVDFDTHTIVALEKVFGARFFGGSMNYLVQH